MQISREITEKAFKSKPKLNIKSQLMDSFAEKLLKFENLAYKR